MLAVPIKRSPEEPERTRNENGVTADALKYKITERTELLAKRKPIPVLYNEDDNIVIADREYTEYGVSIAALKFNASANLMEMAKPRELPMPPPPEFPYDDKPRTKYNVTVNALKYKISDRILKMAKPHQRWMRTRN